MAGLFRESTVGQLINSLSRGRLLPYDDQRPGWKSPHVSSTSQSVRSSQTNLNNATAEAEKSLEEGTASYRVDWYDENDQDNPMNWGLSKRLVVLGLICLLTFSVYIGSAILCVIQVT
jgi:DHA1 family multidrug resistance protein-like MFS transporter